MYKACLRLSAAGITHRVHPRIRSSVRLGRKRTERSLFRRHSMLIRNRKSSMASLKVTFAVTNTILPVFACRI